MSNCRLYLVSPPRIAPQDFAGVLKGALKGGDVASFQLRLKQTSDDEIRRAADALRPLVQSHGAAFILNARPALAVLPQHLGGRGIGALRRHQAMHPFRHEQRLVHLRMRRPISLPPRHLFAGLAGDDAGERLRVAVSEFKTNLS